MNLKLRGYYDYYGITFNSRSIKTYFQQVKRLLFKWLNRRGGRKWNWLEYRKIVDEYCLLLRPRIYHSYRQRIRIWRNRMRESRSYGSVGERGGKEPLYPQVEGHILHL